MNQIRPNPISALIPVTSVAAEVDLDKRSPEITAIGDEEKEPQQQAHSFFIDKKIQPKAQIVKIMQLLRRILSQEVVHLFYQRRRPLKSVRLPKKFHEKESASLFYRNVRPLLAKGIVDRANKLFSFIPRQQKRKKKRGMRYKQQDSQGQFLFSLMSTHYLMARAIHKEPGAEIKETLPRLYDKLQRSFGAILSACGSWSYQALEKNFGSCAFRGDDPLSNHFYFCLTDALNKHAKLIDTQVKTKFSR